MSAINLSESFDTPILFIIFNDPVKSRHTFEQIKKLKPSNLFLAADGPRQDKKGELERCLETRKILNEINWECNVRTFFRSENSGSAGVGVFSAIEWFFSYVEEGIVLEYDIVPHQDFFYFCKALLEKYRNNEKVMVISGSNFQDEISRSDSSYYFTLLPTLWGFATWRRAFEKVEYDCNKINYPIFCNSIPYKFNRKISRYWQWKFNCLRNGRIKTWDYQILFSIWVNNGIGIVSNQNLVSHSVNNISFAENFNTHIPGLTNVPTFPIMPLTYQSDVIVNEGADMYLINKVNLELTNLKLIYSYLKVFLIPDRFHLYLKNIILNITSRSIR